MIKTLKTYFLNHIPLLISLLLFICIQLPLLDKTPQITLDENWTANTAYNYAIDNELKNTIKGHLGGELFFMSPLLMGLLLKILPLTLINIRLGMIIVGLFSILGFYKLLNLLHLTKRLQILTLLLFITYR